MMSGAKNKSYEVTIKTSAQQSGVMSRRRLTHTRINPNFKGKKAKN